MSILADALVTALGLTAVIGVLSGLAVVATEPRRQRLETLTDRWRKRMLPPKKPQKPAPRDEGENPTDDDYFEG